MAVRQIKKSWWVDFRIDHTRYRKRSPENSRAGALAYEAMLRQRLARGEDINAGAKTANQNLSFAAFATTWLEDYALPNNKFSEYEQKRYILGASLVPYFGKLAVRDITAHHIEQYKASLARTGLTGKTIRNRLTVLNRCLASAYEWLAFDGTPPKTKWPKVVQPKTDYLTAEESEQLLSHASGIVYEMLLTTLRTGLRLGEMKALQWTSIDWCNRTIAVRHSFCSIRKILDTPKNYRVRHIPLHPDVQALLLARKQDTGHIFTDERHKPFSTEQLNSRLACVCRRAGLRIITWHKLRHTFATQLAMKGVPLPTVQALLGHSSVTTTMRYAHVAPSSLRHAIELLNPKAVHSLDFGQPVGNLWIQHHQISDSNEPRLREKALS